MSEFRLFSVSATIGWGILIAGALVAIHWGPNNLCAALIACGVAVSLFPTLVLKLVRWLK